MPQPPLPEKILSLRGLLDTLAPLRAIGKRVVFTNGCFDVLHPGHITCLEAARDLGDLLIVGLNSDASVRRLKGPGRPIFAQEARAIVLAGLRCTDYVVVFEDDTPLCVIEAIVPDVVVKGGDWLPERIVGREVVEKAGGRVVVIPFAEGYSTTEVLDRVRQGSQGSEHPRG